MQSVQHAQEFLSTPSARRATDKLRVVSAKNMISIHALREEGDPPVFDFGIPCQPFLSTPSARRATCGVSELVRRAGNFYPRPPRGGRRRRTAPPVTLWHFYPRPPRGGRRPSDEIPPCFRDFYPRPPRGGRPGALAADLYDRQFLSTPSARRATGTSSLFCCNMAISIHALREEGDQGLEVMYRANAYFYPRPPRGGRPSTWARPTSPRRARTAKRPPAPSLSRTTAAV